MHQGALVQAGAIPIFLPTARNAVRHDRRGRLGRVGREVPARADPRESARDGQVARRCASGRSASRASSSRPTTAPSTTSRKVLEKIGHLCDYVLWDEAWIGYNAFHPLFHDHSPMRLKDLAPEMPGLFSTQSVHKQVAGFSPGVADPQARRAHPRAEALRRAQALQRVVPDATRRPRRSIRCSRRSTSTRRCTTARAGEMLWDRCIELGIETRKKLREFGHFYARTGKSAEEKWFFDPFVPDVVTIRGSAFTKDATDVRWEDLPTERDQARAAVLDLRSQSRWHGYAGYARGLRDGRSEQAHAADAGHRSPDRRVPATSACPRPWSRTTCASSASCRRSAISTASCS